MIRDQEVAPPTMKDPFAVTIGACIYMFGGVETTHRIEHNIIETTHINITNALWKLIKTQGGFRWSKVDYQSGVKKPSP